VGAGTARQGALMELKYGKPNPKPHHGKNGVYVVRTRADDVAGSSVLYVGESHTGRLGKTLSRHFQTWEGPTAGPTYDANAVWCAVVETPAEMAVATQNALIEKLKPRDNVYGVEDSASWLYGMVRGRGTDRS
jgi:excinuclease UvrABC nuclease subunit